MKALTIIFCILTIIMLILLSISIIKNDDTISSNKEKKYTLIYIFSFIILMISSIFSTLKMNILSLIFFILFLILLSLATIVYFKLKKSLNNKKQTLMPNKLKNNLEIIKEERDGYTYKINTKLTCCKSNDFKIEQIKSKDVTIIYCTCNNCNNKYEIYNSELDGYDFKRDTKVKILKKEKDEHICKCQNNSYQVELKYEYIDNLEELKEIKNMGISDISNIYTSIKINTKCNKCNKKEKDNFKYETK